MVNIFFDDCISSKMVNKIKEIIQFHPEKEVTIHCLKDYFAHETKDPPGFQK